MWHGNLNKEMKGQLNWSILMLGLMKSQQSWGNMIEQRVQEIKTVNPKGNWSLIFIGRTDDEAEAPIFWPPDAKSWLTGKDPDAGKDWRQEEKGTTEDEMVGWHHQPNGYESEQALGDGEDQGSLACCSPWGHKELDKIERLNNNKEHKVKCRSLGESNSACLLGTPLSS